MHINTYGELEKNIVTFDLARTNTDQGVRQSHVGFVERGMAFIPYKSKKDGLICFIPSRFAGTLNSRIVDYEHGAGGGKTNIIISKILGTELVYSAKTEELFRQFCNSISAKVSKYQRRYWNIDDIVDGSVEPILGENLIGQSTETEARIKARMGQGKFRDGLIRLWEGKCSITQCSITSLLKASHIKPWRDCNDEERLDCYNGLLLLPNIDSLFDGGYITFDDEGQIQISKRLSKKQYQLFGINENSKIKILKEHLVYIKYHRDKIFY